VSREANEMFINYTTEKQVENKAPSSEENIHLHEKRGGNSDKTLDPFHLHLLHTYHHQYLW